MNVERSASEADNPWPGLATFTEEQSGLFHGRDEEIRDLSRRAERNALTVLFGQSGLGKSSLLQAGVFPRLRASNYWPIYVRLDHGPGAPTPTEQIKAFVQTDTVRAGTWTKPGSAKAGETLWEYFHHRDDRLVGANGKTIVPVLVLDQFEELFTLGAGGGEDRARAVAFMSELAELVENRPSEQLVARLEESSAEMEAFDFSRTDYRVVLSLREDFLPHLESLKTIMPALMENRMRLARMTGTQALQAVVKPGGTLVTPEVAQAIVEFVAGARGGSAERLAELDVEPPLLSVICRELNERRRANGAEKITADLVSGNRREILTDFYERSVADLPEAMREYVEDHLLTKSGFRDNVALETVLEAPGVTRVLVDTLVSRRLLRIEDRLGVQRIELTHDVLAEVISASRDSRRERQALEEAQRQLAVQKEREAATRRALYRARAIALVAIIVMLLAVGSAVFGFINLRRARAAEQQAQRAQAGETKLREQAQAEELATKRRAYAADMSLAMQAIRQSELGRTLDLLDRHRPQPGQPDFRGWEWRYLWQQTRSDALATLFRNSNGEISSVAASPDGRLLATGKYHAGGIIVWDLAVREQVAVLAPRFGQIKAAFSPTEPLLAFAGGDLAPDASATDFARLYLWNTQTRQLVAEIPLEGQCSGLAFSQDGQSLVTSTSGNEGQLTVWQMPAGTKLRSFKAAQNGANPGTPFAVSPDFKLAALGLSDGRVHVVDLQNGREVWQAKGDGNYLGAATFSPDGKILATGGAFAVSDIRLWDSATGAEIGRLTGHTQWVSSLLFSPDGKTLYSTSADQTIRTWDVAVRQPLDVMRGHRGEVWRLTLLTDGHTLISGSKDGEVSFWDTSVRHHHRERLIWPEPVSVWKFATEGNALLVMNQAGQLAKWTGPDYDQKEILLEIGEHSQNSGTFSKDNRQLAMQLPGERLGVWDVPGKRLMITVKAATPREYPYALLAQGTRMLTWSFENSMNREWEVSTNRLIQAWPSPTATQTGGLTPDERREVNIGLEGNIFIRDLAAQHTTKLDLDVIEPSSANFSTDGKLFVIPSYYGYVRVWDTTMWKEVATLKGFRLGAHAAAFSVDGTRLVTGGGSKDDTIRLWDTESWQEVLTLTGLGSGGEIGVSADGNTLATLGGNGSLQIWQAPSWEEIAAAEKALGGTGAAR